MCQPVSSVHSDGTYPVCLSDTSSLSFVGFSLHVSWDRRLMGHNTLKGNSAINFLLVLAGVGLNFFTVWGYVNSTDNSGIFCYC